MTSQSDVREFTDKGRTRKKRRFDSRDWDFIADFVIEEALRRSKDRSTLEKHWKEIDRQVAMTPNVQFKKLPGGKTDPNKVWMSEIELPLQAQTLEVLTADARRLLFGRPWFKAQSALTEDYLNRNRSIDDEPGFLAGIVAGDVNDIPTRLDQDSADKLVEGFLQHIHHQYDFWSHLDHINAESFCYGVGLGRVRMSRKPVYINTARGVVPIDQELPILYPVSIRNTYLDDRKYAVMHEGEVIGPSIIQCRFQKLEDLILAAEKGSRDPDRRNGGWMPGNIRKLLPKDSGFIKLLEYEGDLVVPRKSTESVYIPGAIVTVAEGGDEYGKTTKSVVRFRFRKEPFSSYLEFPYHVEKLDTPYASSPLMKGRPVQIAASQAMNRLLDAAALLNHPPVQYDRDDPTFAAGGGPSLAPGESIPSIGQIAPVFLANPQPMLQAYAFLLQQYSDLSGITAPRLGEQTNSHTTAFAKEAELQRGTVRTVDYVDSIGNGPLTKFLHMEYIMGRSSLSGKENIYIEPYQGWVNIEKDNLPDHVTFRWLGAGGAASSQQQEQSRLQSAQIALQIETVKAQLRQSGEQPAIDMTALQREVLGAGGWNDLDLIMPEVTQETQGANVQPLSGQLTGILSEAVNNG